MPELILKNRKFIYLSACAILAALSIKFILSSFLRPLWFDEALTMLDFVSRPDPMDIYRYYTIPNNHIAYNILLRFWFEACGTILLSLRLFSAIAAIISLALMLLLWRRRFRLDTVLVACFCLVLSLPFAIYATAIRGYMLSFLLILLAIELALLYKEKGKTVMLILFFLLSFIASGVMPTNLIAFAAIYLFIMSSLKPKVFFSDRTLWLAIIPIAAFLLFYVPIFGKLLKVLALKEGWSSGLDASLHFYGAFIISFLPLIVLVAAGKFTAGGEQSKWRKAMVALIFLIPLLVFLLKSPAPFPRAFFCLWPIWIFILCSYADSAFPRLREKYPALLLPALLCICVLWALIPINFPVQLSDMLSRGGQDDFFKPYFMRANFRPIETVEKSLELAGSGSGRVFIDFVADYPSIFFYGKVLKVDENFWVFDRPRKKVDSLGNAESIYVIARNPGEMDAIKKRFNMKSYELAEDCGYQKIYKAELK